MQHLLKREMTIKAPIHELWQFFSSPHNLQKITPPYMNFNIVECPSADSIFEGMLIRYTITPLLKIPMTWITRIQHVKPLVCFTDTQQKGPYKLWHHRHSFLQTKDGTLMTDEVTYQLPFGPVGAVAHSLFIKKDLDHIFDYRETAIRSIFNAS